MIEPPSKTISILLSSCGAYEAEGKEWSRDLEKTPLIFTVKLWGFFRACKLSYKSKKRNDIYGTKLDLGAYSLILNGVAATDLRPAPPITKENIPTVCQSTTMESVCATLAKVTF